MEHLPRYLKFSDLKELGIVGNWQTLSRWMKTCGFPAGFLLGANTRVWAEPEVVKWIETQRAERPEKSMNFRGHARRAATAEDAGTAKAGV